MVAKDALWQASGTVLSTGQPLTLTHRRDDGMTFILTYSVDDAYLISITAEASNASGAAVDIRYFARIRRNLPSISDFFISYEGPIGVFAEDQKTEIDYDEIQELGAAGETYTADAVKGWVGITDKYWLTAFVPDQLAGQADDLSFGFRRPSGAGEPAQVDASTTPVSLADGQRLSRVFHLYAGPKKINVLLGYNESLGAERLDHAIDWTGSPSDQAVFPRAQLVLWHSWQFRPRHSCTDGCCQTGLFPVGQPVISLDGENAGAGAAYSGIA